MTPIQTPINWPRLCASLALSVCLALTSTTASTAFAQTTPAAITGSFSAPVAPLLADGKPGFWVAPATIPLSATITAASGNKITEVQFYADSTLIASMTAASDANGSTYKTTWQSVAANSYTLTVKAKDDKGNTYSSAPVNLNVITNNPPQISLTVSPNSATAPATLILSAKASDTDGSISQVEFYNGTNKLTSQSQAGSDGNYRYNWSNVSAGTYNLSAKATDNLGSTTISNAQSVKVASGQAQLYDIHTDQLGTPRLITDGSGQEVWRWDSAPFGETAPNENPNGKGKFEFNLRFPGQYYDRETGLHYNYFRDYDPQTGRYVQSDPIGLNGGINTYGYVGGNSVSYFDSLGLQMDDDFGRRPTYPPGFPDITQQAQKQLAERLARAMRRDNDPKYTYQTYTRYNPKTRQCYSGRTGGYEDPETNVRNRGYGQKHLNDEGFLPPVLDRSSSSYMAIRGREQQLIEINGGAQSEGGRSRNKINGISPYDLLGKYFYLPRATAEFGEPIPTEKCGCK